MTQKRIEIYLESERKKLKNDIWNAIEKIGDISILSVDIDLVESMKNLTYKGNDFEGFTDDICNIRQLLEKIFKEFDKNVTGPSEDEQVIDYIKAIITIQLLEIIAKLKSIESILEI